MYVRMGEAFECDVVGLDVRLCVVEARRLSNALDMDCYTISRTIPTIPGFFYLVFILFFICISFSTWYMVHT
jgi:hypothetical protein